MSKRVVVVKKSVEKQKIIEAGCCAGGMIPFIW